MLEAITIEEFEKRRKALRPAARRVLDAIIAYKRAHDGNWPTRRRLARLASRGSTTVTTRIATLEKAGFLRRNDDGELDADLDRPE
ncbi:MAG: hypothetical protein L0332_34555 [Chloroflexi bacterium]|nr:hypothetical protein [Chloroflexota bacterium]